MPEAALDASAVPLALAGFAAGIAFLQTRATLPPAPWAWLAAALVSRGRGRPACVTGAARSSPARASRRSRATATPAWRAEVRLADALPGGMGGRRRRDRRRRRRAARRDDARRALRVRGRARRDAGRAGAAARVAHLGAPSARPTTRRAGGPGRARGRALAPDGAAEAPARLREPRRIRPRGVAARAQPARHRLRPRGRRERAPRRFRRTPDRPRPADARARA